MDFKFLVTHRRCHFVFRDWNVSRVDFGLLVTKVFICGMKYVENHGFQKFCRPSQAPISFSRLKCVETGFRIFDHQSYYLQSEMRRKWRISKFWSPIAGADFFWEKNRIWKEKFQKFCLPTEGAQAFWRQNVSKTTDFIILVVHHKR